MHLIWILVTTSDSSQKAEPPPLWAVVGGGSLVDFTSYSAGQTLLVLNVETIKGLVLSGSKQQASYRGVDCGQPAALLFLPIGAGSPSSGDHTCLPQYSAGSTSLRDSGEGRAGRGTNSSPHTSIKRPQETCGRNLSCPGPHHWYPLPAYSIQVS